MTHSPLTKVLLAVLSRGAISKSVDSTQQGKGGLTAEEGKIFKRSIPEFFLALQLGIPYTHICMQSWWSIFDSRNESWIPKSWTLWNLHNEREHGWSIPYSPSFQFTQWGKKLFFLALVWTLFVSRKSDPLIILVWHQISHQEKFWGELDSSYRDEIYKELWEK